MGTFYQHSRNLPPEPLTLEGSSVLHSMYRIRWSALRALSSARRSELISEMQKSLHDSEREGQSAVYSMFGHKADLLILHFRPSFEELKSAELAVDSLGLREYLEPSHSYLSMVELGLYESSLKLYQQLTEKGIGQNSPEWAQAIEDTMTRQREAMMDRRRGEDKNWYVLPIENRQKQMDIHGTKGRRWAGKVFQIISGSIGFDDW